MITPHGPIEAGEISEDIVIGDASGYKIARGSVSVTGTADVTTGLTTVASVTASLGEDANANADMVTAAIGGTAGHADLKVWKLADGTPNTLVASGVATTVNWIAIGT